jgi:predicted permease
VNPIAWLRSTAAGSLDPASAPAPSLYTRVHGLNVFPGDLRFSLRTLAKSPGFAITAIVTMALAIGANAVVFAVMNGLILRPLDLPRYESLYGIEHGNEFGALSYPNYLDLRDRNHSFESLPAYTIMQVVFDPGRNPSQAYASETSGSYFDALGIHPYLGHFFHASDEHGPNSAPWVVLTWAWWHTHFQDDRGVIGRVVQINRHPFTVIGVTPPSFQGTLLFFSPDMFIPLIDQPQVDGWNGLDDRSNRWVFEALGHLRPGVTPAIAVADLNSIGADLEKIYPGTMGDKSFALARPSLYGNFLGRPILGFMAGLMLLSALILLAACANLGSLFAARASDRSREVALRLALGSSRRRILCQLMTEAVLLSVAGGLVGLGVSIALLHQLSAWRPLPGLAVHLPASPDAKVYVVALLLAVLSGVLFGIVPVRQVLRANPYEIVKAGSSARGAGRMPLRDWLLVVQIALCAVLVTSSLVAVRGLVRALHSDVGFNPQGAMLAFTDMSMAGYADGPRLAAMQKRMIDAMRTIPGVQSAATINTAPLGMGAGTKPVFRDGAGDFRASNAAANPYRFFVSPGYFQAAQTPLLAGRAFTEHDGRNTPPVAIVNHELARSLFGSVDSAIGRYFQLGDGTRVQIVGIVEDGKYLSLTEDPRPAMFLPVLQTFFGQTTLVVRSTRDPQELTALMRNKLRELDPGLPTNIDTWSDALNFVLFPSRMATLALGVLGIMGAMLSVTGIFGMAAGSVSRRMRELGVRIALGAQRGEVLRTAIGRAIKLLTLGSAAGMIFGILASRLLSFIVYRATPRDPWVLGGVVFTMLVLGLIATWIPAERALSINPLTLLREE